MPVGPTKRVNSMNSNMRPNVTQQEVALTLPKSNTNNEQSSFNAELQQTLSASNQRLKTHDHDLTQHLVQGLMLLKG